MLIRPASAQDRDSVVALWHLTALTRPWNDPVADFDMALAGPSSTVLVGLDAAVTVATAMVGFDGHRGWIYYLAVHPEHRRSGLGGLILAAAEAWLREQGAPKVQLMVRRGNATANDFYEALGYSVEETDVLSRWLG